MPNKPAVIASLALALSLCTGSLHAQALPTEEKAGDLQIGGVASGALSDYAPQKFYGPGVYVDFDVRHRLGLEASFDYLNWPAPTGITEKTYQVGVRYRLDGMRHIPTRVSPYLRGSFGRGVFNFGHTVVGGVQVQNADLAYNLFSMGGGIDYHFKRSINLRLVDFQYQDWLGFPPNGLTPMVLSVGLAYHFH